MDPDLNRFGCQVISQVKTANPRTPFSFFFFFFFIPKEHGDSHFL